MKHGQLSRIDLWQALNSNDMDSQAIIVKSLGLRFTPEQGKSNKHLDDNANKPIQKTTDTHKTDNSQLSKSPTKKLTARYWQVVKQEHKEDTKKPKNKKTTQQKVVWRNRPLLPKYLELIPLKDCRSRVLPELNKQQGRLIADIPQLIHKISRAEFIQKIPKKKAVQTVQSLHLIDDRQRYLIPYWLDHSLLSLQLYKELASYQISRAVIPHSETQPKNIIETSATSIALSDYQMPPAGTSVLIFSDLGRLSYGAKTSLVDFNQRQQQYWQLIQSLLKNNNFVIVISPCNPRDYPSQLHQKINLISWQTQTQTQTQQPQWNHTAGLELLLTLASPCSRLEPEILRSLRVGLQAFGIDLPVVIESFVWQHSSLKSNHSVAASFDSEQRKQYREKFTELDKKLQAFAIKTIRQWRAKIADEVWFIELLDLESTLELEDNYQDDLEDACQFLQAMTEKKIPTEQTKNYQAWFARQDSFIRKQTISKGSASRALQVLLASLSPNATTTPAGHSIAPELLGKQDQATETHWLCQKGNQFVISDQFNPALIPQQGSSLIAPIKSKNGQVSFQVESGNDRSAFYEGISPTRLLLLKNTRNIPLQGELIIKTDLSKLTLKAQQKPAWASAMGRDAYGLYAEIDFSDLANSSIPITQPLIQRFRWIPAGRFFMGTQKTEVDRDDDEDLHQVTLTQGYWLADTTVTQILWESIMVENNARFKEANQPIEYINWDDTQRFIQRLNEFLSLSLGNLMFRLPTEAEWEYACRADTQTPFYLGGNISPEQVNYNGAYPYANGTKGQNRQQTVAVKHFQANPWGLYEMHGNVWEWCADAWKKKLGELPVTDPYYDKRGALRVVRGGSWNCHGGLVRSAFRHHDSPDNRNYRIGFRLSLGHELPVAEQKEGK